MTDLAERIRELTAMQASAAGEGVHAVHGVIELAGIALLHNAPTILAGLAALDADQSTEIARLKAENERMRDAITAVLREADQRADWRADNWNPDAHIELTLTIAEVRALAGVIVDRPNEISAAINAALAEDNNNV